jgi:hypothetical protein
MNQVHHLPEVNARSLTVQPASANAPPPALLDADAMDRMIRVAEVMANGKTTIPAHLRGNVGDCLAIISQAVMWQMNPFAVAQKTHLINGVLGYEAQLVAAVINQSGAVQTRFFFDWFGPWDKVIGKYAIKKGEKGEYRVPGWSMADEEGCGIRVWATLRGEKLPRELSLLLAQARTRNSTLWADDPKQQLAYLAQKRWARLYAPDVILGVYTPDDYGDAARPATTDDTLPDTPPPAPLPVELLADAEAAAAQGLQAYKAFWQAAGEENRKRLKPHHDRLRADAAAADQARTVEATTTEPQTEPAPAITFAQVLDWMIKARSVDVLNQAADLIGEVAEPQHRAELTARYDQLLTQLRGTS